MGIFDNGVLDTVEWASPLSHYEPPDPLPHSTMPLFHPPPLLLYHVEKWIKERERGKKWEEVVVVVEEDKEEEGWRGAIFK